MRDSYVFIAEQQTKPSFKKNYVSLTSGSKMIREKHKQKYLVERMQMKWICCGEK